MLCITFLPLNLDGGMLLVHLNDCLETYYPGVHFISPPPSPSPGSIHTFEHGIARPLYPNLPVQTRLSQQPVTQPAGLQPDSRVAFSLKKLIHLCDNLPNTIFIAV